MGINPKLKLMTEEFKESVTLNETDAPENTGIENQEDLDLSSEDLEGLDDDTSKKLQTSIAQKKHWRDKYEQQTKALKELEGKLEAEEPKEEPKKVEKSEQVGDDKIAALELKIDNPELSMENIKKAMTYAKVEGSSPSDVINSTYFKAMISEESRKERVENAAADPSTRAGGGRLNFERIAADDTGAEYKKLSADDRAKFRDYQKGKSPKGGLRFIER